ncbi:hypothetical protein ACQ5SO_07680 [Rhodovulum sp. DZ06]|uniref:hypothetical protein n=1 Tax=Rhodovulum sp. DZ06 TaxID=3425126 RepID=UPI003D33F5C1
MLRILSLYLPALIPSWRFFKEVAPSPRIEYGLSGRPGAMPTAWQEARPRPERVSPARMLRRMLWNPRWNETLFMTSCAERIVEGGPLHDAALAEREIARRILRDLGPGPGELRFRLVFVRREGDAILREVEHVSGAYPRAAPGEGR